MFLFIYLDFLCDFGMTLFLSGIKKCEKNKIEAKKYVKKKNEAASFFTPKRDTGGCVAFLSSLLY